MAWTINGTRIYVQKISDGVKGIIAILQPLSGGSVYQAFGYESPKYKVGGLVVGSADKASIEVLATSGIGTYYELVSPEGSLGTFLVSSVSVDRDKNVYQSLRTDLDCTTPVYAIEIELLKD